MNTRWKAFFLAVASAAGISSGAATYNGDLFLGFTTQSGKDVIFDVGQADSLFSGQTFDLTSSFTAAGISDLSSVKWGVLGDKTVSGLRYAWTTTDGSVPPLAIPNTPTWGTLDTATRSIASQFSSFSLGQSVTPDATFDNSWNQQTISGPLTTQYHNVYENPNVTGPGSTVLYRVLADGSSPVQIGSFSLDPGGSVSFSAVPEPGTYVLFGVGLLALFGRRFRRA